MTETRVTGVQWDQHQKHRTVMAVIGAETFDGLNCLFKPTSLTVVFVREAHDRPWRLTNVATSGPRVNKNGSLSTKLFGHYTFTDQWAYRRGEANEAELVDRTPQFILDEVARVRSELPA